jgi:hypothetical protein
VNVPVNVPVSVPVTTPTSFGIPWLPLSIGGGGKGKGIMGDFLKQGRSYQPSLTASVLGIKGARPSDYAIKTGLVIRPL